MARNNSGQTCLHLVTSLAILELFLTDYPIDANVTDNEGRTALFTCNKSYMQAQDKRNINLRLLRAGANPNHKDKRGDQPFNQWERVYYSQQSSNTKIKW